MNTTRKFGQRVEKVVQRSGISPPKSESENKRDQQAKGDKARKALTTIITHMYSKYVLGAPYI